ncbi:DUF1361 domain-containing protein [Clostridium sediminicola]|uniref:DUF1361 domain-containing protein n=1 Tax=Clostridium sediminicola TaxID=3114879 RepID=UPI0031F1D782
MENNKKIIGMFSLLTIVSTMMLFIRVVITGSITYMFFTWNLFLCIIPLYLSIKLKLLYFNRRIRGVWLYLIGFIWLLFYPNAPYIITDFVHLSFVDFFQKTQDGFLPIKDLRIWYDLIIFFIFIMTGFFMGLYSLYNVHEILKDKLGKKIGLVLIFIITFLSGFAIYLGRYLRLNSWNIVTHPIALITNIFLSINMFSLGFTLLFTLFLFLIYSLFYSFLSD